MHPRNFDSDFLSCDHLSAPQVYQCRISQSTGIPNKCNSRLFWREITWPPMSCEAETIIKESLKTKQKAEIVSASLLSKVLILAQINCHVHKFGIQRKRKTQKTRKQVTGQRSSIRKRATERARARDKKQKRRISLKEQCENFAVAVRK